MTPIRIWISAGLIAVAAGGVVAAADMAGVVHDRQARYKEIGKAFKAISEQLKSPAPQLAVIRASASQIDQLAPQVPGWFPAGSGAEAGVKTEAKADIWAKPADFKTAASGFAAEAHKFDTVAAGGDLNAVQAEFPTLGKACKTCHESFRQKD
jgi:cytochrome c556